VEEVRSAAESQVEEIDQLVQAFLLQPVTPEATWQFENAIEDQLRELGRGVLAMVYNQLEADTADEMPKQVQFEGQEYSRKNEKTNNRNGVGTVFGKISLVRFSYEPLSEARDEQQKSFSPLELSLGIVVWALSRETLRPPWPNAWGAPQPATHNEKCWSYSSANTEFTGRPRFFVG